MGPARGCGIFSGLDQFFKGIEGDVVVLYHTGCAMVVTTDYPFSAHRISYLHNLFQNGAPTLSGVVEVFHEKIRRGELEASEDLTFVMITGDGGMDIGLGPTLGTASRNHRMIVLEYDNQGYMNTGGQLSYSTPLGHATSTSHVGPRERGHRFLHRDTPQLLVATGIPYVFTAIESPDSTDLVEKAAKAQWYARREGLAFGKILVSCPLNWKSEERDGFEILRKAVDCCFFPLYDVQRGKTRLGYDPDALGRRARVSEWLRLIGKSRHLCQPENQDLLERLETEIDLRWRRLKARVPSPALRYRPMAISYEISKTHLAALDSRGRPPGEPPDPGAGSPAPRAHGVRGGDPGDLFSASARADQRSSGGTAGCRAPAILRLRPETLGHGHPAGLVAGRVPLLMAVTALWGRVWCGWPRPQTVVIDLIYRRITSIEGDSQQRRNLRAGPWTAAKLAKIQPSGLPSRRFRFSSRTRSSLISTGGPESPRATRPDSPAPAGAPRS